MHAVVLTFDRLPAHLVGCYGNEWIETPGFDALAAQATVYERHLAEIPGPAGATHPWWTGRLEFFDPPGNVALFETLATHNVRCRLVSERDEGLPEAGLASFEHITGQDDLDTAHDAVPFARLVARGEDLIRQLDPGQSELIWLHSAGVPSPWLPPEFFAGLYLDELEDRLDGAGEQLAGDVLHQLRTDPVLTELLLSEPAEEDDADEPGLDLLEEAFGEAAIAISRFVFAGYVSLIDHWLRKLTEVLSGVTSETLFIVTAAGGHAFGEQQSLLKDAGVRGAESKVGLLGDQLLQTPLMLWQPRARSGSFRLRSLVQPLEVAATLCDWFGVAAEPSTGGLSLLDREGSRNAPRRDVSLHFSDSGEVGLQDEHWFLSAQRADIELADDIESIPARLYAKPDDFWETNELSAQSPDECQRLLMLLQDRLAAR